MICGDCNLLSGSRANSRQIDKQTRFRLWRCGALENARRQTNGRAESSSGAHQMERCRGPFPNCESAKGTGRKNPREGTLNSLRTIRSFVFKGENTQRTIHEFVPSFCFFERRDLNIGGLSFHLKASKEAQASSLFQTPPSMSHP